jgi:phosphoglycolate phosphatase
VPSRAASGWEAPTSKHQRYPSPHGGTRHRRAISTRLPFQLFLFDLDGTIVDSLPDIAGALNAALAGLGLVPLPIDVVRGLIGEGVHSLAGKALSLSPAGAAIDPAVVAREIVRRYAEHPCLATRLYPGIAAALAALRARGARLAVLTNKPGAVARALLAELPLDHPFDVVIGDGDGFPRKPAPDAALAIMAQLAASPARTLMVGDGLPDLALARAARCPVAAATWGYTDRAPLEAQRPDYLLEAPSDLLGFAVAGVARDP